DSKNNNKIQREHQGPSTGEQGPGLCRDRAAQKGPQSPGLLQLAPELQLRHRQGGLVLVLGRRSGDALVGTAKPEP
ncbi:unnamed protein product, partial [Polarella glacialis]